MNRRLTETSDHVFPEKCDFCHFLSVTARSAISGVLGKPIGHAVVRPRGPVQTL